MSVRESKSVRVKEKKDCLFYNLISEIYIELNYQGLVLTLTYVCVVANNSV